MFKNCMEEVSKVLGVEMYEEFNMGLDEKNVSQYLGRKNLYRITERGLEVYYYYNESWLEANSLLSHLLLGNVGIVKIGG